MTSTVLPPLRAFFTTTCLSMRSLSAATWEMDAHEAVALGEAGEDPDGLLKALVVQRAEAFIEEEGIQPDRRPRARGLRPRRPRASASEA